MCCTSASRIERSAIENAFSTMPYLYVVLLVEAHNLWYVTSAAVVFPSGCFFGLFFTMGLDFKDMR